MLPRRVTSPTAPAAGRSTLSSVQRHAEVRVVRVSGQPRLIQRLAALGVVPGASLKVLRPRGPAVVAIGGARIAIGKNAARSVEVEVVE